MKKQKQPTPKKGTQFLGWATFNWGMPHNQVYRTRKQAKESLLKRERPGTSWDDIKGHFMIVKVKCTVV